MSDHDQSRAPINSKLDLIVRKHTRGIHSNRSRGCSCKWDGASSGKENETNSPGEGEQSNPDDVFDQGDIGFEVITGEALEGSGGIKFPVNPMRVKLFTERADREGLNELGANGL
ncbi:hypothetical protein TNCV_2716061 [Trichonephila clavipes]|nr:hypothetical protein TNCV_2716061 [Trichonephila clavipes]